VRLGGPQHEGGDLRRFREEGDGFKEPISMATVGW
jgi:hypothetical protein